MTAHINFFGMPYFPGVATGRLCLTGRGAAADCILLISPHQIDSIGTRPAAFIVVDGAPFSHHMIGVLARGVPTVFISGAQAQGLEEGRPLLVDGGSGRITDEVPAQASLPRQPSVPAAGKPVRTADGAVVELRASVRQVAGARQAVEWGAVSVGLVRSEYLVPRDDSIPGTAFYRQAFGELCQAAAPLSVTIRLLDLAAGKKPAWMPASEAVGAVLGLQGVRLYGLEPVQGVIDAQLAAIDALAEQHKPRLLVPYLSGYEELVYWLDRVRHRLSRAVPVGAMAETPAGALDLANWLEAADFVSIGCNDLMQCLYAADRDRPELQGYLNPYAPFLFRFFAQVADLAADQRARVQLCGVLPQLQGVLPVLLGLGYRAFSVDVPFIPYLAKIVTETSIAAAEALATDVCAATETREVLELLHLPAWLLKSTFPTASRE
jgi:phosphoenolpyruvate-protein kinase (PTS system EI component)